MSADNWNQLIAQAAAREEAERRRLAAEQAQQRAQQAEAAARRAEEFQRQELQANSEANQRNWDLLNSLEVYQKLHSLSSQVWAQGTPGGRRPVLSPLFGSRYEGALFTAQTTDYPVLRGYQLAYQFWKVSREVIYSWVVGPVDFDERTSQACSKVAARIDNCTALTYLSVSIYGHRLAIQGGFSGLGEKEILEGYNRPYPDSPHSLGELVSKKGTVLPYKLYEKVYDINLEGQIEAYRKAQLAEKPLYTIARERPLSEGSSGQKDWDNYNAKNETRRLAIEEGVQALSAAFIPNLKYALTEAIVAESRARGGQNLFPKDLE